jgi:hypothetical protein
VCVCVCVCVCARACACACVCARVGVQRAGRPGCPECRRACSCMRGSRWLDTHVLARLQSAVPGPVPCALHRGMQATLTAHTSRVAPHTSHLTSHVSHSDITEGGVYQVPHASRADVAAVPGACGRVGGARTCAPCTTQHLRHLSCAAHGSVVAEPQAHVLMHPSRAFTRRRRPCRASSALACLHRCCCRCPLTHHAPGAAQQGRAGGAAARVRQGQMGVR